MLQIKSEEIVRPVMQLALALVAAVQVFCPTSAQGQTKNRYRSEANRPGAARHSVVQASAQMPSVLHSGAEHLQPRASSTICGSGCDTLLGSTAGCRSFLFDWSRADLWVGVTGFTGPGNFIGSSTAVEGQVGGAFGFQEGFNFGAELPSLLCGQLGSQIGVRLTHTNLDGSTAGSDSRNQMFLTAGLFRRVDYGLQGGLVVDYLHDDWIYKADLLQLRGELSFLLSPIHDLGFRFTSSQQTSNTRTMVAGTAADVSLQSLDTYRFFYRVGLGRDARATAELMGGFTEESTAVWGAKIKVPLQAELGLETNVLYGTAPNSSSMPYAEEVWNVSLSLVWTPGRAFGAARDYYRPLFDVADNASLLVQRIMP